MNMAFARARVGFLQLATARRCSHQARACHGASCVRRHLRAEARGATTSRRAPAGLRSRRAGRRRAPALQCAGASGGGRCWGLPCRLRNAHPSAPASGGAGCCALAASARGSPPLRGGRACATPPRGTRGDLTRSVCGRPRRRASAPPCGPARGGGREGRGAAESMGSPNSVDHVRVPCEFPWTQLLFAPRRAGSGCTLGKGDGQGYPAPASGGPRQRARGAGGRRRPRGARRASMGRSDCEGMAPCDRKQRAQVGAAIAVSAAGAAATGGSGAAPQQVCRARLRTRTNTSAAHGHAPHDGLGCRTLGKRIGPSVVPRGEEEDKEGRQSQGRGGAGRPSGCPRARVRARPCQPVYAAGAGGGGLRWLRPRVLR